MRTPTKKLVYILCLISALCTLAEVALAFANIPAALLANGALAFFCIAMLFNIDLHKKAPLAIFASILAIILSIFSSLAQGVNIALLAFPVYAISTVSTKNRLVTISSIAVIVMGVIAFMRSYIGLPFSVELYVLAASAIINAAFCIVMIKNKEIISND